MGAEPYEYLVDYDRDIQAALDRLRAEVFASGRYHGSGRGARTAEEALELAGEDGTRSILDIATVAAQPDYCCAAPFTDEELSRYCGTKRPSVEQLQQSDELWDELERGQARYAVIYEGSEPRSIFFVGYSFD
jgi:hypothetical protein